MRSRSLRRSSIPPRMPQRCRAMQLLAGETRGQAKQYAIILTIVQETLDTFAAALFLPPIGSYNTPSIQSVVAKFDCPRPVHSLSTGCPHPPVDTQMILYVRVKPFHEGFTKKSS